MKVVSRRKVCRETGSSTLRDRLLQLPVVLLQERLLRGGIGESKAQPAVIGARIAPNQVLIDPLDDAAFDAHHRYRQDCIGQLGCRRREKDLSRQCRALLRGIVGAHRIGVGNQRDRGRFDDVAVLNRPRSGNARRIRDDRIRGKLDRTQRQYVEARTRLCRSLGDRRRTELHVQVLRIGQVRKVQRQIVGQQHELASRRDALPCRDNDDVRIGCLRRRRRHIRPETVHDAETGRLAQVGLALQEVVLLARQIPRREKAAVEPEWSRALAVERNRTVALIDRQLVREQRDASVALYVSSHVLS